MSRSLLPIFGLLGLVACGHDPQKLVGGGSDQPNKIQAVGRILTPEGAGARNAQVTSWVGNWDPQYSSGIAKAFDSSRTDSAGKWTLRVPDTGLWYVTAKTPGYRAVSKYREVVAQLEPEARIHGTVQTKGRVVLESMWVGGTNEPIPFQRTNDSSATFDHSLFPGPVRVWGKMSWAGGSDTFLLAEQFLDTGDNPAFAFEPDTGNVLLASAQASPMRSALRGIDYDAHDIEAGEWFVTSDQKLGGTSSVAPSGFPDPDSAVHSDLYGKYFSWNLKLGAPIKILGGPVLQPWAGVGIRLSRRDLDWSGVHFLRLLFRGSSSGADKIWIQVNTTKVDRLGGDGQLRYSLDLPSGWSQLDVPLGDFKPMPGSKADSLKLTWNEVKGSVRDVVFYTQSAQTQFELQELRAIGNRLQHW